MYESQKSGENKKGDVEVSKVINNKQSNKREELHVSELLQKGINRYDKALEKLSKN